MIFCFVQKFIFFKSIKIVIDFNHNGMALLYSENIHISHIERNTSSLISLKTANNNKIEKKHLVCKIESFYHRLCTIIMFYFSIHFFCFVKLEFGVCFLKPKKKKRR